MKTESWARAVADWRDVLGGGNVLSGGETAAYERNITGLRRSIPAVLLPASTAEVRRVVEIANRRKTPLYPVSRGKNWGFGSRLPSRPETAVLDLGRMNRVLEVDADKAYAVVEAGVSQGELYDYLQERQLPLLLNVIGSGRDSSLIGNALDRGIGYFDTRADSLYGLEVVLGSGRVLRTGYAHFEGSPLAPLYRQGLGPSLGDLFAQSNYGIVTRAAIPLIPRPEKGLAMVSTIPDEARLPAFVDALKSLLREGIVRTVVHVGNRFRSESSMLPLVYEALRAYGGSSREALRREARDIIAAEGFGPWSAMIGLYGTRSQVAAARRAIRRRLAGISRTLFLTDELIGAAERLGQAFRFLPLARRKLALLQGMKPIYGLARGVPTDQPMKSTYWTLGQEAPRGEMDLDAADAGMLYCVPFVPMEGEVVRECVDIAGAETEKSGFELYMTLNTLSHRVMEGVISVFFDKRDPDQVQRAHDCVSRMQEIFMRRGMQPYRVGIQSMQRIVDANDTFWQTARDLKQVLDPNNIVAPGRYNLI